MATEKILNTRIQLKYDTLSNWNSSTFKLKAGELAIVTVGEMKDGSTHENAQYPVLFKVGTGKHTFSELPFASALAADVYAWAKAADVKLEGKSIKFVDAEGKELKKIDIPYITETEASTLISNALTSYSTTTEMNAAITVEANRAKAAEEALGERIDAFNLPEGGFASQSDFDALREKIEDEDGALARANAAYALAETKVATTDFEAFKTTNSEAITKAKNDAIADAEGKLATAKSELADDIKDVSDALDAYKTENNAAVALKASDADLQNEINRAKGEEARIEGLVNGITGDYLTSADKTELSTAISTEQSRAEGIEAGLRTDVDNIKGDYLKAADKTELQGNIDTLTGVVETLRDGIDADKVDGVKDLIKYVEDHGPEVTGMKEDIADNTEAIVAEAARAAKAEEDLGKLIAANDTAIKANAQAITDHAATAEATYATKDELAADKQAIQNQIDTLGIQDGKVANAATADVANSLSENAKAEVANVKVNEAGTADIAKSLADSAKAEVEKIKVENAGHADVADKASGLDDAGVAAVKAVKVDDAGHADNADKLGNVAAENYALKTDAQGYATTAETNAKAYAKEYADGLAGNYATAEQGAKADSALQSIEVGTGLKVSAKENNKQTIDIDESVVFVFNCGSSTTII